MKQVQADLEENAQHNFEQDRCVLQMYTFCWHWLVEVAENRWKGIKKEKEKVATMTGKSKVGFRRVTEAFNASSTGYKLVRVT